MTHEFLSEVRSTVEPTLAQLGFQIDAFDDDIQVYRSTRADSVNCMIAPLGAAKVFGPYDQSKKWQYLPRFALRQGTPLEEIANDKLPVEFPTNSQQLEWVRGRIEKYFPVAHAGVLELFRPEWRAPGAADNLPASVSNDANDPSSRSTRKSSLRSLAAKLKLPKGSGRPR